MLAPIPPAILEVYYAPSCAPCRLELPVLAELVRDDHARVRTVIVSEEAKARRELSEFALGATAVVASRPHSTPRATLLAARDTEAILPYARALTPAGKVCARWRGRLAVLRARALLAAGSMITEIAL
jgi:thiol-disulfide isomerase/thioredoxin